MMCQTKPSLRPEAPRRRSRLSICLAHGLLSLALVVGTGCGPQASTSDPSGSQGTATGSIAFAVQLDPASGRSSLANTPAVAAQRLNCGAVGISSMRVQVLDESNLVLRQRDFDCEDGKGTVTGVPVGTNRHIEIMGLPNKDGPQFYHGSSSPFTVSTVVNADAGVVPIKRIESLDFKLLITNLTPTVGKDFEVTLSFVDAKGSLVPGSVSGENVAFTIDPPNGIVSHSDGRILHADGIGTAKVTASLGSDTDKVDSNVATVKVGDTGGFQFMLSVTPPSQLASPGSSIQYQVTAKLPDGTPPSSQSVDLSVANCPPHVCSFSRSKITPNVEGDTSILTVVTRPGVPDGTRTLEISATGGEAPKTTKTVTANITVVSGPLTITTFALPEEDLCLQPYFAMLSASGGRPPYNWSTFDGGPPAPGLRLDPTTGSIEGVMPFGGTFRQAYVVQDIAGTVFRKGLVIFNNCPVG